MAFEIVTARPSLTVLPVGKAGLDRKGNLRFTRQDWLKARLEDQMEIVLFADVETNRLAIRAPNPEAKVAEPTFQISPNKSGTRITIRVASALVQLGIEPQAARGEYPIRWKKDLMIVEMGAPDEESQKSVG